MKRNCPYCDLNPNPSEPQTLVKKAGTFRRKSDCRIIQRYQCLKCEKYFSAASLHPAKNQNKRQLNNRLRLLLCSGVSLRRSARLLNVSRTTIKRKFEYLGARALVKLKKDNLHYPPVDEVQFDDQESFEHTKCKPLSITLAVDAKTRRILGFEVSQMPAKGHLAKIAFKKYGKRKDRRSIGRIKLFETLKPLVRPDAVFKSDENPHYPVDLKRMFPKSTHQTFKGERGSIVGQGELKKVRFDPLFSLNHTCAMTRANMNRLFRRTWCTTKIPERLKDHFAIYADYHNSSLLKLEKNAGRWASS